MLIILLEYALIFWDSDENDNTEIDLHEDEELVERVENAALYCLGIPFGLLVAKDM